MKAKWVVLALVASVWASVPTASAGDYRVCRHGSGVPPTVIDPTECVLVAEGDEDGRWCYVGWDNRDSRDDDLGEFCVERTWHEAQQSSALDRYCAYAGSWVRCVLVRDHNDKDWRCVVGVDDRNRNTSETGEFCVWIAADDVSLGLGGEASQAQGGLGVGTPCQWLGYEDWGDLVWCLEIIWSEARSLDWVWGSVTAAEVVLEYVEGKRADAEDGCEPDGSEYERCVETECGVVGVSPGACVRALGDGTGPRQE
jgi:hypothetical protein